MTEYPQRHFSPQDLFPLRITHDLCRVPYDELGKKLERLLNSKEEIQFVRCDNQWTITWKRPDFHLVQFTITAWANVPWLWKDDAPEAQKTAVGVLEYDVGMQTDRSAFWGAIRDISTQLLIKQCVLPCKYMQHRVQIDQEGKVTITEVKRPRLVPTEEIQYDEDWFHNQAEFVERLVSECLCGPPLKQRAQVIQRLVLLAGDTSPEMRMITGAAKLGECFLEVLKEQTVQRTPAERFYAVWGLQLLLPDIQVGAIDVGMLQRVASRRKNEVRLVEKAVDKEMDDLIGMVSKCLITGVPQQPGLWCGTGVQ